MFNIINFMFNLFVFVPSEKYNYIIMVDNIGKKLGKRIQYLRKQRGLSQEKLAEAINIATTSLSFIETGRGFMTLSTLEKMAIALNVEPHEIFQFVSVRSNEDMYEYLIKKLDIIKNDSEKLNLAYTILKNIL